MSKRMAFYLTSSLIHNNLHFDSLPRPFPSQPAAPHSYPSLLPFPETMGSRHLLWHMLPPFWQKMGSPELGILLDLQQMRHHHTGLKCPGHSQDFYLLWQT